ncbi:MAG: hypothetical protein AAF564_19210 [Bacteroidota bacterium]
MANYLLKKDSMGIEPAEFEDLSNSKSRVVRAYKHGRKSNEEVTKHPLAKNLIRQGTARSEPKPVEIFVSPLFDPNAGPQQAEELDEEALREAAKQAELKAEYDQVWQAKLDAAVEQARTEAYGRGYAEAKEASAQEVQKEKDAFVAALNTLKGTWESFINRSETLLLEIALDVAHFLVDAPLPERLSKATESALLEALEVLSREVPIRLSLNPVDFLRLQESGLTSHLEDQFATLRWDPQPTLKEGNWIIQTPRQAIRRVSDELLASLRDRFGLNENTQRDLVPRQKPTARDSEKIPPVTNIAVTTTSMAEQQEIDLSSPMSFTTATSTAANTLRPLGAPGDQASDTPDPAAPEPNGSAPA